MRLIRSWLCGGASSLNQSFTSRIRMSPAAIGGLVREEKLEGEERASRVLWLQLLSDAESDSILRLRSITF